MRDLFAMLFAANLVEVIDRLAAGSTFVASVNAFGALVAFISWRERCHDDKKEAE